MRRIVAVAVFALVVSGCAPRTPSAPPPTSLPSPTTATVLGWEPVGPSLGPCDVTAAVVRASGELLAVCQDGSLRTHILTTRDGLKWQADEPSGITARDSNHVAILNAIAEGSDGTLVLVGAEALDDISSGDAAAWTSRDGIAWARMPSSKALQDAEMTAVGVHGNGFLAVGADGFPGGNVQLPGLRAPAVWRSTDASAWTRGTAPPVAAPMLIEGVLRVADGWVAWGGGAAPGSGAVWTSTDGDRWTISANPAGARWGPIGRIATAPDGALIAAGSAWDAESDALPGLWRSTDAGATWTAVDVTGRPPTGALWDVIQTGHGLLATGAHGQVVESANGRDWEAESSPGLGLVTMRRMITLGGFVIAFGSVDSEDAATAAIWRRNSGE